MKLQPYRNLEGARALAKELHGRETVHVGVRPYGFHAGNALALVAYPFLLCELLEKLGKEPRFKLYVSINDWEQDALDGPDYRTYPFNVFPEHTILRYALDDDGCHSSIVDHWEPIIGKEISRIADRFPKVQIKLVRNSKLLRFGICKRLLLKTLQNPHEQLQIMRKHSDHLALEEPVSYARAICPSCHSAHTDTKVEFLGRLHIICRICGHQEGGFMSHFQYWWYHKPLLIARIAIFGVDVLISGGDHFTEGDFQIRREFLKHYLPSVREPRMLFSPTLISLNGERMSKSKGNTYDADVPKLIEAARTCTTDQLLLTEELLSPI